MHRLLAFLIIFLTSAAAVIAQVDTINLPQVELEESLIILHQEPGQINITKDTNFPASHPIDVLNHAGVLFINQQGFTGLASQNLRNVGFSRSLISWNGLAINSPRNGGLDYQLLTPSIENFTLYDGGRSGKTGSGAIGGELVLKGEENSEKGIHGSAGITAGNFDLWLGRIKTTFRNNKYKGSLKADYQQSNNDFNYQFGANTLRRNNSAVKGWNLLQDNSWKINSRHTIKANVWWQQFERDIPQGITAAYRGDHQSDENLRLAFTHLASSKKGLFKTVLGYLNESITYQNDLIPPQPGIAKRLFLESKYYHFKSEKINFSLGVSSTQDGGDALFSGDAHFNQTAGFGGIDYFLKENKFSFFLRQTYINELNHPLTGNLIWTSNPLKKIQAYIKLGRDYRFPSINDRFWIGPGGLANPNLIAERSWLQEGSIALLDIKVPAERKYEFRVTAFSMLVDDWIQWIQNENGLWQPQNLKKVWSRGIKLNAFISQRFRQQHFFKLTFNYQYNPSTNSQTYSNLGEIIDKQLPRAPLHHGALGLKYNYGQFACYYTHHYTGKRFENPLNSIENPAYQLGNILLSYQFSTSNTNTQLAVHLNNVFNVDYAVIPGYPMPGIHGKISALFEF